MNTLAQLLGSAGRTEVLRTLIHLAEPTGIRQVARIAGVHPHTAELVLGDLVQEGLATRRKSGRNVAFTLVRHHPGIVVLESAFKAADDAMAGTNSVKLSERAARILPFIRESTRMINRAREQRHVA